MTDKMFIFRTGRACYGFSIKVKDSKIILKNMVDPFKEPEVKEFYTKRRLNLKLSIRVFEAINQRFIMSSVQEYQMTLRILIAEDNKELADAYHMVLTERNHEVMITNNGVECQSVYKQYSKQFDGTIKRHFDVVILDQKMPGMDGIETAKEIQKLNPKQKIIFITGNGMDVLQKLGQLSENAAVVNKPFTVQSLLAQVEGIAVTKFREKMKSL